ncbi:protein FAM13B-like isoform X27 [Mytilus californianus]|uniref:protein FAM13B-like isoform X27 n=1 Tax=Mytilus californianus TaxID=6549 RepID=UPI0022470F96|nr:protein FAM13B-like isoform X27 [Mytilus californianus]
MYMYVKLYNNVNTMTDIPSSTKGLPINGSMDKMKKLLSPGTRKKVFSNVNRTFGVHLDDLLAREGNKYKVPFAVMKICETIAEKGLDQEGIFRVSGSSKIIEKLRGEFDIRGDANLEEDGDIAAVAGLLKLFLRELPVPLVPENRTQQFVCIQDAYQNDIKACLYQLKQCLHDNLPKEHYNLLKYLSGFLVTVAKHEKQNKMTAMSLAIVFGPNIFRCAQGIGGLRDQGAINQVVYKFVAHYNSLFRDENEDPPELHWIRHENYDSVHYQDGDDIEHNDHSETSSSLTVGRGNIHSPMFSDDEITGRAASPFILDSDGGYSIIESPVPSARTSKVVEHAITKAITNNLFGDEDDTEAEDEHQKDHSHEEAIKLEHLDDGTIETVEPVPILDRIKAFQKDPEKMEVDPVVKPLKARPVSKAFDLFESRGIMIAQAPTDITDIQTRNTQEKESAEQRISEFVCDDDDDDEQDPFEVVRRNSTEPLPSFKRTSGPLNRRSPSRKSRGSSGGEEEETPSDDVPVPVKHNKMSEDLDLIMEAPSNNNQENEDDGDMNHNHPKPRVAFLELTNNREEIEKRGSPDMSPSRSPSNSRKPFIPPLDLSTLHEHVDSTDPILATKGHSVSYLRAKNQVNGDDVMVSPRTHKLKKHKTSWTEFEYDEEGPLSPSACLPNSVHNNTDFPPSPPVDQDQYRKHSTGSIDDDFSVKHKQIIKKIQAIKKKIKHFEESFEQEQGFKPSHADKISRVEVKKWLADLTKAKKDLRKLKEEAEMGSRSRHGSGASSSGERMDPPDLPPSMEQTLILILRKLKEKRRENQRPEDIELMNRDQVQEEKLAVQKALLHFESIHGRPKSKEDKDLMRPLYDRYRQIKRLITKPMSPREKMELQTVPEDGPIDLIDPVGSKFVSRNPIILPRVDMEEDEQNDDILGTMEFAVTRDFSVLRDNGRTNVLDHKNGHSPKVKRKLNIDEESEETTEANLHEMNLSQLQDELLHSRSEKKRLRRLLRNFEEDFILRTGRKVQRDDREPLQSEYHEYKQIKAKLKLLDALISKYQPSSDL